MTTDCSFLKTMQSKEGTADVATAMDVTVGAAVTSVARRWMKGYKGPGRKHVGGRSAHLIELASLCSSIGAHHVVVGASTAGPERPQQDSGGNCGRRGHAEDATAARGHGPGVTIMATH